MFSLIRGPKDFWTGVIYIALGLTAIIVGRDYPLGSATKMGAAYFPTMLGWLLVVIGALSGIRSFIRRGERIQRFAFRQLGMITIAVVLFGLTVRGLGLVVALPILILVSAYGSAKFRWLPALALTAGLTVFCIIIFLKALGVPLPIVGPWLGG